MTVKCLTDEQKIVIAYQFNFLKLPVEVLCDEYKRSPRTIYRVLDEKNVSYVRRRRGPNKPKTVSEPLVMYAPIVNLPEPAPSGYQMMMTYLKTLFIKTKARVSIY